MQSAIPRSNKKGSVMDLKKLLSLPVILCCIMLHADSVTLDSRGRLNAAGLLFSGDFYSKPRNYTQGYSKEWKLDKLEKDRKNGIWRSTGIVQIPKREPVTFSGELKRTGKNKYVYDFVLREAKYAFTLRSNLPGNQFAGRTLKLDGEVVQLPVSKEKSDLKRASVRKIEIPCDNGTLIIESGNALAASVDDYRPGTPGFSLRLKMEKGEPGEFKIRLNITYRPFESTTINLRKAVNMGFADKVANDGKGGWTDQGPENDLRMLKTGVRNFRGTFFDIIEPNKNGGRSTIVLAGAQRDYLPLKAETEVQGRVKGKYLFLLHASAWVSSSTIGTVKLTYADGTTESISPRIGRDVGNWWCPTPLKNGEVVWTGENNNSYVGLFRSVFPIQEKEIRKIEFQTEKRAVWMVVAASVGNECPPQTVNIPHFITAGKDWKPIDFSLDTISGSVLDFSWRLDAPAGKYGPAVIRNGRFEFHDKPGIQQRFYGVNLCSSGPFLSKEWAERFADRMARNGFNIVRIHHHDPWIGRRDRTCELDADNNDKLDYLIYCLKKRGIYLTTDLYISRRLPAGEIPEYPGRLTNIGAYKGLFWILDSVWENWKKHTENYLAHVNPYTGVALKDDPVLVSVNVINEGNIKSCWSSDAFTRKLYEERFAEWRKKKNLPCDVNMVERNNQFEQFLTETYWKRFNQMIAFLRANGLKTPLADQNMGTTLKLAQMRNAYDYADTHAYINHPVFPRNSWKLPSVSIQNSAIASGHPVPYFIAPSRLFGKPYAITEWDYAYPNKFRAEGAPIIGAYAGLQGWDMLVQFAYSHGQERLMGKTDVQGNYFDVAADPIKNLSLRIGGALFSQDGIRPAEKAFVVRLNDSGFIPFDYPFNFQLTNLARIARVGVLVNSKEFPAGTAAVLNPGTAFPKDSPAGIPVFDAAPGKDNLIENIIKAGLLDRKAFDRKAQFTRSLDGSIEMNRQKETFRAVSPVCEVLVLPAEKSGKGSFLSVKNISGRGVIAALSAEKSPLKSAKRVLLLHLTDCHRTNAKFSAADMRQLENWGTFPYLAQRGEAEITLKPQNGEYQLFAVDSAGKTLGEIPLKKQADGSFKATLRVFQPFGQVFAYELKKISSKEK